MAYEPDEEAYRAPPVQLRNKRSARRFLAVLIITVGAGAGGYA
jgi:hypothetical protein